MLKPIFSRPSIRVAPGGWIVEVTAPVVGAKEPMQRLFAVGVAEKNAAEVVMRDALGNLHCTIMARIRLTSRALASFDLADGRVKEIDAD